MIEPRRLRWNADAVVSSKLGSPAVSCYFKQVRALSIAGCVVVLVAGCSQVLGLDQDYGVSTENGGGAGAVGGADGGHGGTTTGGSAGTGGVGAGGSVETITYEATIADCVDPASPNPDQCANPTEALWIDQSDMRAYLRFEPDDTIAGATIISATLRLTVGTYSQAQGDTSGEMWEVEPFTRPDLFNSAPLPVGSVLAGDQGPADPENHVAWPLPVALVVPSTPVYLGVIPVSFNSVGYLNLNGTNPPQLVVEYQ